jgi:hypothetical protein
MMSDMRYEMPMPREEERKVGCFALTVIRRIMLKNDEEGYAAENHYLVKDFEIYEGDINFYAYVPNSKMEKMHELGDNDFPLKLNTEDMFQYYERVAKEVAGTWVWYSMTIVHEVFMRGRFEYSNKVVITDPEMTKYVHNIAEPKEDASNVVTFGKKE